MKTLKQLIEKHKKIIASLNQEHHRELFSLIIEDLEQSLREATPNDVEEDVVEKIVNDMNNYVEKYMYHAQWMKKVLEKHLTPAVKQVDKPFN